VQVMYIIRCQQTEVDITEVLKPKRSFTCMSVGDVAESVPLSLSKRVVRLGALLHPMDKALLVASDVHHSSVTWE